MKSASQCINKLLTGLLVVASIGVRQARAQTIAPAPDGTGTIVTPVQEAGSEQGGTPAAGASQTRLDISGGQLSGDGANLFHSFSEFGVKPEQTANFLSNPSIQNILGRVVGGDVSKIDGIIRVTGGNSNLFLMNPAGIVFGPNASLNVPASFTATTANGIGFGSNWFNSIGANDYAALVGKPSAFAFTMNQPGAIANYGNLSVLDGQNLTLIGGTAIFFGNQNVQTGYITATAVPGQSIVRINQPGMVLSLDVQPLAIAGSQPQNWTLPILSLPELLTGGGVSNANRVTVNSDGQVELTGSGIRVEAGDVLVDGKITANGGSVALSAARAIATGEIESSSENGKGGAIALAATGDITTNNISSSSQSGSGGDISLTSKTGNINTGNIFSGISGDFPGNGGSINLIARGNITTKDLLAQTNSGNTATISLSANGNVTTGNLSSISEDGNGGLIGVISRGNIATGELRAQTNLGERGAIALAAVGNITTSNLSASSEGNGGSINVIARGDIATRELRAQTNSGNGGSINLSAGGNVNTSDLYSGSEEGNGGSINIDARGTIDTGGRFSRPQKKKVSAIITQNTAVPIRTGDGASESSDLLSTDTGGQGGSINLLPGSEMTFISPDNLPVYVPPEFYSTDAIASTGTVEGNAGTVSGTKDTASTGTVEGETGTAGGAIASTGTVEGEAGTVTALPEQIVQQIEERGNQEFGEGGNLQPLVVPNIQEMLGRITREVGLKHAVVYVRSYPDQLELLLVSAEGQILRKSIPEAKHAALMKKAKEFYREIRDRNLSDFTASQELYKWLIAPLEPDLKERGINTLLFVLDEGLRSIPLAALYDGKEFLVEKYSISLIPIISLIDARYVGLKNAQVLAMGRSEFTGLGQEPLPSVPAEIAAIAREWQGEFFLNQQFTLENLKSKRTSQPFRIVHLATHANFQTGEKGNNSYIQLWDTKLRLDQLRQLRLYESPKVELLVLSACETALGDDKYAEMGFAGLAVQAGVKSAVASLWRVKDVSTLGLMSEFYKQLRTAPTKAEALRQAQIAMLKGGVRWEDIKGERFRSGEEVPLPPELTSVEQDKTYSHPYYWAAFTMIGSPW